MNIKKWSRRRKVVAATLALALVAGAAVALVLLRAPLTGDGTISAAPELRFTSADIMPTTSELMSCTATVMNGGSSVNLSVNGARGTQCDVLFGLVTTGQDIGARLQDVRFSASTAEGFIGATACGAPVPAAGTTVGIRFAVPADAPLGSITVDAAAGVFVAKCFLGVHAA